MQTLVRLLGQLSERLPQGSQLPPQVLGVSIQYGPQLLSIWSQVLLDLLGFLGQLGLKALGQGDHALLKLLQALLHLLLYLLGVGDHLGLQPVHALIQLPLQLLALLQQDGPEGLGVHGVGVGSRVLLQPLHLPLEVSHQLVGVGLQAGPHSVQVFLQAGLQLLGLLGKLQHEVLGQGSHLSPQSVGELVDGIGALRDEGAAETQTETLTSNTVLLSSAQTSRKKNKKIKNLKEIFVFKGPEEHLNMSNSISIIFRLLLHVLAQLGLSDLLQGVLGGHGRLGNIVPESIFHHVNLLLGLVLPHDVGIATC